MRDKKSSPTQKALNLWAVIVIVWSIFRAKFQTTFPIWIDELIIKPLVFILPVYYYITVHEKKPFLQNIWFKSKALDKDILYGLGFGLILFTMSMVGYFFGGGETISPTLIWFLGIALATSISEEVLSRGFILKRLYEESQNIYTSSLTASVLYFFLKVPILFSNPSITGGMLLQIMFVDILFSLAISFIYLQRKSLLTVIILHTFYSFALYMFM